jgi:DNA adenine methylase
MSKFLNPLRYPGSKAAFVDEFSEYIKLNGLTGRQIVEPYAGSASISLGLVLNGTASSAILVERDPLVYSFWYCVFYRTCELIASITELEISLRTWHEFDRLREVDDIAGQNLLELGLAGLFFNRTNFSGVIHAGPIGGQSQGSDYAVDCRFNKVDLIKRIRAAAKLADRVEIYFGDAVKALRDANNADNENRFFYIDPPYYKQGKKLYRYHYNDTAHKLLADTLSEATYPWILSYDNHHVIEHHYASFHRITKNFRYSSRVAKQEKELLITNVEDWIDEAQQNLPLPPAGPRTERNLPRVTVNEASTTMLETVI